MGVDGTSERMVLEKFIDASISLLRPQLCNLGRDLEAVLREGWTFGRLPLQSALWLKQSNLI